MNVFDIGIVLVLLMFIIVGFKNGVINELAELIGIIVIFVLSFMLKGIVGGMLCTWLPFFDFYGAIQGMSSINILLYQAIAFIFIFSVLLSLYIIILKIGKILEKIVRLTIVLWLPSKILGGLVSFIKGYIILFVIFVLLLIPFGGDQNNAIKESKLINKIVYKTPILSNSTSNFTNSIKEAYELGLMVSNKEISSNEADLKNLDFMLKYDVVDRGTVEKLKDMGKLKIDNIDSVLEKY